MLSGGRLDLGVGVGWQREEYDAAGLDFDARGGLLDHSLAVCQTLWREPRASYADDLLAFEHIHQMPKPLRPGGVPVWVSGTVNRRVARRLGGSEPAGSRGARRRPTRSPASHRCGRCSRRRGTTSGLQVVGSLRSVRTDGGLDLGHRRASALGGRGHHRLPRQPHRARRRRRHRVPRGRRGRVPRRGGPGLSLGRLTPPRGHQPRGRREEHPVGGRVARRSPCAAPVSRSWVSGSTPDSRPRPRDEDETNSNVVGGVAGRKRLVQLDVRDVDEAGAFQDGAVARRVGRPNGPGAPWGRADRGPPPTSRTSRIQSLSPSTPPEQREAAVGPDARPGS